MESTKRRAKSVSTSTLLPRVRAAARGRWLEIITALASVSPDIFDRKKRPCPKCGGNDRFRAFRDFSQEGGVVCSHCADRTHDGLATLSWLNGWTFPESLKAVAAFLNLAEERRAEERRAASTKPISTKPRPTPANLTKPETSQEKGSKAPKAQQVVSSPPAPARLEFLPWNPLLAAMWCKARPPIKPESLELIGARFARYSGLVVIAIPVWGEKLKAAEPVNWLVYNAAGGDLPTKDGPVRKKIIGGGNRGLIGLVDRLGDKTARKVKTEGPTDLLALLSADLATQDCLITNVFGANEDPEHIRWLLPLVAESICITVHDQDQSGRDGLHKWSNFFAETAAESRAVTLPFEFKESHGNDLRDYFSEGASPRDWELLIDGSPIIEYEKPKLNVIEEDDDPHRLARANLDYYEREFNRRLVFWNNEWWRWKEGRYIRMSNSELRAKINRFIRLEFEKCWKASFDKYEEWRKSDKFDPEKDKGPPTVQKISQAMVNNVIGAMEGMAILPSSVTMPCWLPDRSSRHYVATANSILDLKAVCDGKPAEECILPHNTSWFSMFRLDYPFLAEAQCPDWLRYIEYASNGDSQVQAVMQEWAGYLLTPTNYLQRFLVLEGEGKNGKTVFFAAMTAMLGKENVSHVSIESFSQQFALSSTLGKAANISGDAGQIDSLAEGALKQFTGGDAMTFDRKNREPISVRPTAKLMAAWNTRPRIKDRSDGVWRRMILIPFNREVSREDRITGMDTYEWWLDRKDSKGNSQVAGILKWAIVGLNRLRENGEFTECDVINKGLRDYKLESNPAAEFLEDFVEMAEEPFDPDTAFVPCSVLYDVYSTWCKRTGHTALGSKVFGREVKKKFRLNDDDRKQRRSGHEKIWCYVGMRFQATEIDGIKISDFLPF